MSNRRLLAVGCVGYPSFQYFTLNLDHPNKYRYEYLLYGCYAALQPFQIDKYNILYRKKEIPKGRGNYLNDLRNTTLNGYVAVGKKRGGKAALYVNMISFFSWRDLYHIIL